MYTMSETNAQTNRPMGMPTSIGWMGWPNMAKRLRMGTLQLELAPHAAEDLGAVLLNLGMSAASLDEGQGVFSSGTRIEPRTR